MSIEIDPLIIEHEKLLLSKYEQLMVISVPIASRIISDCFEITNLNIVITEQCKSLQKNMSLRIKRIVDEFISNQPSGIVVIDYFELLFENEMKLDPFDMFLSMSKKRPIIIIWRYEVCEQELYYSKPNHPDFYKKKLSNDIMIIRGGK